MYSKSQRNTHKIFVATIFNARGYNKNWIIVRYFDAGMFFFIFFLKIVNKILSFLTIILVPLKICLYRNFIFAFALFINFVDFCFVFVRVFCLYSKLIQMSSKI